MEGRRAFRRRACCGSDWTAARPGAGAIVFAIVVRVIAAGEMALRPSLAVPDAGSRGHLTTDQMVGSSNLSGRATTPWKSKTKPPRKEIGFLFFRIRSQGPTKLGNAVDLSA